MRQDEVQAREAGLARHQLGGLKRVDLDEGRAVLVELLRELPALLGHHELVAPAQLVDVVDVDAQAAALERQGRAEPAIPGRNR